MTIRNQWFFFSLLHELVMEKDYDIISIAADFSEVWLQVKNQKPPALIRLLRRDFPWSRALEQDIKFVYQKAESFRKQRFSRKLSVQNIYITNYEPFNDLHFQVNSDESAGKQAATSVETILLHGGLGESDYDRLRKALRVSIYPPTEDENQLAVYTNYIRQKLSTHIAQKEKREYELFHYGKPLFSFILLFVQVVMFLVLEWTGGSENTMNLIKYGAKYNPYIFAGEWWRFLTPVILHIGLLHLLMNSFALYSLGPLVEGIYGRFRFLIIYLFSGFTGVLGSFLFSSSVSAGASGAIFGCFGALLYISRVHPQLFLQTMGYNIIGVIVANLIIGFLVPGIDNAGHIGGLAGGFLAASILALPKNLNWREQVLNLVLTVSLLVLLLSYGFTAKNLEKDAQLAAHIASQLIQENEYKKTIKLLNVFREKEIADERIYFFLSYAQIKENQLEQAKLNLEKAVEYNPSFHEAYYNLALVYIKSGNKIKAAATIKKAIKLNPENKQYRSLLSKIEASIQ